MNIQKKTSILLVLVIIFYSTLLITINTGLWNSKLRTLDIEQSKKNNFIIIKYLEKEKRNLALILKDYSRWDETFNFVNNKNKDYIDTNFLGVDTNNFSHIAIFSNNGMNLTSFKINSDGSLSSWDLFKKDINKNSFWFKTDIDKILKGFIKLNGDIFIIGSSPILANNTSTNSNGLLIFAKLFTLDMANNLRVDTSIDFNLTDISQANSDFYELIKKINNNNNLYIDENNGTIITYSLVYDIHEKPLYMITTSTPKRFELIGKDIEKFSLIMSILIAILTLYLFYKSMNQIIINPIKILQKIFQHISAKNEVPSHYFNKLINNNDEISELTKEFKVMNDKIFDLNQNLENTVKQRTKELLVANENLRLVEKIVENTSEGIMVTDLEGYIIRVNKGFLLMSNFSEEEVIGKNPNILKSGRHSNDFYKDMWDALINIGSWSGEIWNRRKDGAIYPKWLTINTIKDSGGSPLYYIGLLTDITKLKEVENELNHLAYYDSLTGLPNRALFYERLLQSIKFNKRYRSNLAVFFIDLDRFKNINDTMGHSIGDELLMEVATRIKNRIRESDTVCRIGGDEFLIILDKFNNIDDVAMVATDIINVIEEPIVLLDKEIKCSASLGISLFPEDDDTPEGLMRKADSAMYQAKDSGKGVYKFFSQDMEDLNTAKLDLEIQLRKALEDNQFELFYQPQIDIKKYLQKEYSVVGCEALIRWRSEENKIIPPDLFIPIAEETGMIIPIGKWVIETACATGFKWYAEGNPIRISVNVSSIQFEDPDFISYLDEALNKSGLPPHLLHLELTESMLLNNLKDTIDLLNAIKTRGILFSIDDFGTGFSSLSYIKELPASNLKIDKGFIFKMDNSDQDKALVKVIISIAKTFGMKSLAEGVETLEHLNLLNQMGCEEIQGYYISKPLPQKDFENFLKDF